MSLSITNQYDAFAGLMDTYTIGHDQNTLDTAFNDCMIAPHLQMISGALLLIIGIVPIFFLLSPAMILIGLFSLILSPFGMVAGTIFLRVGYVNRIKLLTLYQVYRNNKYPNRNE